MTHHVRWVYVCLRDTIVPLIYIPSSKLAVNWMNFKMFGTIDPDLTGSTQLSGSHHTIAFYRKAIGHFMPGGTDDYDPDKKTGNQTRSKQIRDLIKTVKDLSNSGGVTPKKTKRSSEELAAAGGTQKKKAKTSRKNPPTATTTHNVKTESFSVSVSDELGGLLRRLHNEKARFVRSLDGMRSSIDKIKQDVETSYGVMISQVKNVEYTISNAQEQATTATSLKSSETPTMLRTRNLFTQWSVFNGKLGPLDQNWTLPAKLSVLDALNIWFLGDPPSHTPPIKYLTIAHMKHIKNATENFNKLRKLVKICKYLGIRAGYWAEHWDADRITTLWNKILPDIESHLGLSSSNEVRTGEINYKTLLTNITKEGRLFKDMADNSDIFEGEDAVMKMTEEAAQAARGTDTGGEEGESTNLELLWGIHHGKLNPLPANWDFPVQSSILEVIKLWLVGDAERKIPPFLYIQSRDVCHIKSGTGYLSKYRCVMKVITHWGIKLEYWYEEGWDDEKIKALWGAVWDSNAEKLKFKRCDGKTGECTWQSVYNQMHTSGLLKELSADKDDQEVIEVPDEMAAIHVAKNEEV